MNTQTPVKQQYTGKTRFAAYVAVFGVSLLLLVVLSVRQSSALTPISQGFTANKAIATGSIVSLKAGTSDQVVASTAKNAGAVFGVVISTDSSLLSLNNGKVNQVQVATSGTVPVLVSDING